MLLWEEPGFLLVQAGVDKRLGGGKGDADLRRHCVKIIRRGASIGTNGQVTEDVIDMNMSSMST